MKNLTIEIPQGFEISEFDIKTGKVSFKEVKKEITERVKTFDDACREIGTTEKEFQKKYDFLENDTYAFQQIKVLAKALNEGTVLNWDNENEYKYYIWFDMRKKGSFRYVYGSCAFSDSAASACYKTRELCNYAGTQFEDIYRKFFKG